VCGLQKSINAKKLNTLWLRGSTGEMRKMGTENIVTVPIVLYHLQRPSCAAVVFGISNVDIFDYFFNCPKETEKNMISLIHIYKE
jgi:hypothetical protein